MRLTRILPLLLLASCSRAPEPTVCRLVGSWEWRTRMGGGEFLTGEYVFATDGSLIERRLEPDRDGIAPLYGRADGVLCSDEEHLAEYSGAWRLVSEDADRITVVMLSSWEPDRVVRREYEREGPNAFRSTEDEREHILVRRVTTAK